MNWFSKKKTENLETITYPYYGMDIVLTEQDWVWVLYDKDILKLRISKISYQYKEILVTLNIIGGPNTFILDKFVQDMLIKRGEYV